MKAPLLILSFLVGTIVFGQTYNMPAGTNTVNTCSGTFYDSGGSGGNYGDNQNRTYTICPTVAGNKIRLNFTSFATENNWDYLYIYDGTTTGAPLLGTYTGTISPGIIQATAANASGCITCRFTSDNSFFSSTDAGWAATITCIVPCQSITSNLISTNEAAGAGGIIRACQGQSINFVGSGTFSNSSAGATYSWDMGNGATVNGTNINYTYPAAGAYIVNLNITDPSGCTNSNAIAQKVYVSTTPTITTSATPSTLCTNATSAFNANVTMTPYVYSCTPPVSGTTFLPDGSGVSYTTSITPNCYNAGATVTSVSDISSICVNMEHSHLGDLSIAIQCPNGTNVILKSYPGGGTANLGQPWATGSVDGSSATTTPGTGATYCFTPSASTTMVAGIVTGGTFTNGNGPGTYSDSYVPAGNYASQNSLAGLVGCPLNGTWSIIVTDNISLDNGYIFNWDINFASSIPTVNSFTPSISSQGWVAAPTLTITGPTTANVTPTNQGTPCFTYSVTDDFGCTYTAPQCITVNCGASLPVGLVSFDATAVSNQRVKLEWRTSSEINSDYFLIQRSVDGENWKVLETIDAAGNSEEMKYYSIYDDSPYSGTSYYRLLQYDLNGSLGTTDMEAVYLNINDHSDLVVFPNPSSALVTVKGDAIALSTFEVVDITGRNLRSEIPSYDQGDNSVVLDISALAKGVYTVKCGTKVLSLVKE